MASNVIEPQVKYANVCSDNHLGLVNVSNGSQLGFDNVSNGGQLGVQRSHGFTQECCQSSNEYDDNVGISRLHNVQTMHGDSSLIH